MTVIHTFGAVIEQLSLTIEIMVKCSHAGPSYNSVDKFNAVLLGNGNLFTLWNRIIAYMIHKVYSGLSIKQLITNQS